MTEKYIVRLTAEEREELTALASKGKASAAKIRHAQVLLKADATVRTGQTPGLRTPSRSISIPWPGFASVWYAKGWKRR